MCYNDKDFFSAAVFCVSLGQLALFAHRRYDHLFVCFFREDLYMPDSSGQWTLVPLVTASSELIAPPLKTSCKACTMISAQLHSSLN